ncbi:hypothetical protein Tco_0168943 [Tanacetum coccineum]
MEALKFADSHNMVAYLDKSTENADFDEIVHFLNANPILYALAVSPTICVSYIEQFWSTAKTKTVNNETQIRAKVDGKTIVIIELSVRRDLHFNDEDAVFNDEYDTPSHTKKVFANMRRQGKDFLGTVTPLFATMLIQSQAVEGEDETVHEEKGDNMERVVTTVISLDAEQGSGSGPSINITIVEPVITASAPIATIGVSVSTARPSTPPTTITTFIEDEDLIIAQTLIKMRSVKSKEKRVSSETATRPIPEKLVKVKGKDQIEYDADMANRLQAELDEEVKLEREREEEASNVALIEEWDTIEARIDADA